MFVDPASISSGWALFLGTELIQSGTVLVDKKQPIWIRLREVYKAYKTLSDQKLHEVHIEQLVRNTHIYTHWSVAAIGIALHLQCDSVGADIPIQSWQKHCDWKGEKKGLEAYQGGVTSEDELAAIGMGLWYLNGNNASSQ